MKQRGAQNRQIYDVNAEHLQYVSDAAHLVCLNCMDSHTFLKHLERI